MNNHLSNLRTYRYHEITVGMKETHDYVITPEVYENFLAAFHDYSPLHTDEEFAKSRGFHGRVMHGSLLNGFISHFVGMHFPGRLSLLLAVDMRFSNPSHLGDAIRMDAVVSQKVDAHHTIVMDAILSNTTRNHLAARARINVMVKDES
jgi:3-hydroxybutyryl-CoA dehydratase